jgi:ABC-type molybdate transport system substrate-binding protein
MNAGMHYKLWWHHKKTNGVARANSSFYQNVPKKLKTEKDQLAYIFESLIDDVKSKYDPVYYNLKIEIKAVRMDHEAKPHEIYPITVIGDQTKIEEDIEKWGY